MWEHVESELSTLVATDYMPLSSGAVNFISRDLDSISQLRRLHHTCDPINAPEGPPLAATSTADAVLALKEHGPASASSGAHVEAV